MNSSIVHLSTEFTKAKNSFAVWLVIVGAICIPALLFLTFVLEWKQFIPAQDQNPWDDFLIRACNGCCFFAQITTVLMVGLIVNIEHEANGWKQIFVMPLSRRNFFVGKLTVIVVAVVLFIILYFVYTLLFGLMLDTYRPLLLFGSFTPEWTGLASFIVKFFISLLGMIAIQFWLSYRIKNLSATSTIGILSLCLGLLLKKWEYIAFMPYAAPFLMLNYTASSGQLLETYHWVSLGCFAVVTTFSYFDFTKRFNGH